MNKSQSLFVSVVLVVFSTPIFAVPVNSDQNEVKTVVENFWASSRPLNWKGMEARIEFPFTAMPVGFNYSGKVTVYRSRKQFEWQFQDIKKLSGRGLRLEVRETQAGSHVSQLKVEVKNQTFAYVTYAFQPNGGKTPYKMLTVLKKGQAGWKIVFSTVPG